MSSDSFASERRLLCALASYGRPDLDGPCDAHDTAHRVAHAQSIFFPPLGRHCHLARAPWHPEEHDPADASSGADAGHDARGKARRGQAKAS